MSDLEAIIAAQREEIRILKAEAAEWRRMWQDAMRAMSRAWIDRKPEAGGAQP